MGERKREREKKKGKDPEFEPEDNVTISLNWWEKRFIDPEFYTQ